MDLNKTYYAKIEASGVTEPTLISNESWAKLSVDIMLALRQMKTRKDGSGTTHGTITFSDSPLIANEPAWMKEARESGLLDDVQMETPEQTAEWARIREEQPWTDDPEFKQFQSMMVPSRYITAVPGEIEGLQSCLKAKYGDAIESHIVNRRA